MRTGFFPQGVRWMQGRRSVYRRSIVSQLQVFIGQVNDSHGQEGAGSCKHGCKDAGPSQSPDECFNIDLPPMTDDQITIGTVCPSDKQMRFQPCLAWNMRTDRVAWPCFTLLHCAESWLGFSLLSSWRHPHRRSPCFFKMTFSYNWAIGSSFPFNALHIR